MSKPQQPELDRSGLGEVDQEGRYARRATERQSKAKGNVGKVPAENQPGHKPERQQDKPRNVP